jgi:hypothetical protein
MRTSHALARASVGCLLVAACGRTIPLESHSACPCAAGWSCCNAVCMYGSCPPGGELSPEGGASNESFALLDPMTTDLTTLKTPWYSFSDRTCAYSCPPVYTGAPGTLSPPENTDFPPTNDGNGPTIDGKVWPYREVSGGGETTWGAGFGFDFNDQPAASPEIANPRLAAACSQACIAVALDGGESDGSMVGDAASSLDASADQAACLDGTFAYLPAPYDASAHAGISFWVRAPDASPDASSPILHVLVSDRQTSATGGICTPCVPLGAGSCNDNFGFSVPLTPTWTQHIVPFSQLLQEYAAGSLSLESTTLESLDFELETPLYGGPLPSFRVQIAYLEWVDERCAACADGG